MGPELPVAVRSAASKTSATACFLLAERAIGGSRRGRETGQPHSKTPGALPCATILLCSPADSAARAAAHSAREAIARLSNSVSAGKVLPGRGAAEVIAACSLRHAARASESQLARAEPPLEGPEPPPAVCLCFASCCCDIPQPSLLPCHSLKAQTVPGSSPPSSSPPACDLEGDGGVSAFQPNQPSAAQHPSHLKELLPSTDTPLHCRPPSCAAAGFREVISSGRPTQCPAPA